MSHPPRGGGLNTYAALRGFELLGAEVRAPDAPVFIKPLRNVKTFPGHVRNVGRPDAMHTAMIADDRPIACSEVVEFESEWRCFMLEGRVLDVRRYKGTFRSSVDWSVLDAALESFREQPAGFAMDLGVLTDGRTAIVEVNDGYSVGAYGLPRARFTACLVCSARPPSSPAAASQRARSRRRSREAPCGGPSSGVARPVRTTPRA